MLLFYDQIVNLSSLACADSFCRLLLLFGASYDTSPVKAGEMSVTLPMGKSYRFGAGTQYKLKDHLSLGFLYELSWMGTLDVNQTRGPLAGTVAGEYKDAAIHVFHLALQYQV